MNYLGRTARFLNGIVGVVATVIILLMLFYGGYSLWDNEMVNHRAFISDELLKYKPNQSNPQEYKESFAELCELNEDVVGWITINDTNIDYPVLIGENDMYYVNHDIYGEFSVSGAIFLSSLNARDFSDEYNMVYGHHMDNGAMFGNIMDYLDEDYYDSHRMGSLCTLEKTFNIEVFACVSCDAYDKVVYSMYDFSMDKLRSYLAESALYYDESGFDKAEKIIAMSTCASAVTNGRVVVFGRLYEENSERREEE